jgi:hypothetical protein
MEGMGNIYEQRKENEEEVRKDKEQEERGQNDNMPDKLHKWENYGSLFYDAFSVTRLYSVDDKVKSERC